LQWQQRIWQLAQALIKADNITKKFGRRIVLNNVNFEIEKGDCLTIFGPNGVGKTTLIRILSTMMSPTKGDVIVEGQKAAMDPIKVRRQIGVISHNPFLYAELTAYENLRFYGKLYQVSDIDNRIDELLELVELSERKHDVVGTFSKGMMQRISIARALLHKPTILFLDEPHSGLDPHAAEILDNTVKQLRKDNTTLIMATHNLDKGLQLASRVIILSPKGIVLNERANNIDASKIRQVYLDSLRN